MNRRALPEFRRLLETEGQALLERIDDWLSAHAVLDGDGAAAIRLGVGIYHIQDRTVGRQKATAGKPLIGRTTHE